MLFSYYVECVKESFIKQFSIFFKIVQRSLFLGKMEFNYMIKHPIQLAIIGAAHGTKGEVRVKSFTANPEDIAAYGVLHDQNGRQYEIINIRTQKSVVIVQFKGVHDRNGAEMLNGTTLYVDREQLPDDLEDDEFYHSDLIGLSVRDEIGNEIGSVNALFNFGGGDLLELKIDLQKLIFIPFTKAAVPEIHIKEGFIVVDSIAAGLIEENYGEGDEEERK